MITVSYFKIKKGHFKYFDHFFNSVPVDIQKKISGYSSQHRMLSALTARLLLKKMFVEEGYPNTVLSQIKTDEFDRPYLDDKHDLNITHSGDYVVCAISKKTRIGVDVEKIKKVRLDQFNMFLSEEDLKKVKKNKHPNLAFFKLWSQKEAVSKANGKGLGLLLPDITITGNIGTYKKQKWNLTPLPINTKYVCYLAYKGAPKFTLVELQLKDLIEYCK